jgi:hypothetical protein
MRAMSNSFDHFADLPEQLQVEALREAERRLESQLTVATAADQRALAWAGFLLTGATGALGGGIALLNSQPPRIWLGYIAIVFAAAIFYAAWLALETVAPSLYCMPGNRPANWLPDKWACVGTDANKLKRARIEQAEHLDGAIEQNMHSAKVCAVQMHKSLKWTFCAVISAGAILVTTVTVQQTPALDWSKKLLARWWQWQI